MHEKRSYGAPLPLDAFLARNLSFLAHWHTDVELLYVVSGAIIATVNQDRRLLGEGSLVVCGSRDIHHYERAKGGSETILAIFKPELLGHLPSWPAGGRLAGNFATKDEHPRLAAAAGEAMRETEEEMRLKARAYDGMVRGKMIEPCALAERELAAQPSAIAGEGGPAAAGFPALERMQLAIATSMSDPPIRYDWPTPREPPRSAPPVSPECSRGPWAPTSGPSGR